MRNLPLSLLSLLLLASALAITGCTNYYRVTDPTTGRNYYTTRLEEQRGGSVQLTDARTGNMVTVQNSEVKKITKEEYESGKFTAPTPAPAPANQ
jgi:hypothetical protein